MIRALVFAVASGLIRLVRVIFGRFAAGVWVLPVSDSGDCVEVDC